MALGSTRLNTLGTDRVATLMRASSFALALLAVLTVVSGARADVPNARPRADLPGTHWCRAGDPPLDASARTPCDLAAGVVNSLFNGPVLSQTHIRTISVRSPVTKTSYRLQLVRRGDYVTATGPNEIWVRFYYDG
jgi:hypothetical protein